MLTSSRAQPAGALGCGSLGLLATDPAQRLVVLETALELCVIVLDSEGRILTWGPRACMHFGHSEVEVLGQNIAILYDVAERDAGLPALHLRSAHDANRCELHGWRLRKDGAQFWARIVLVTVRDDAGVAAGFACITRDLTASRESAEFVRKNESFFRSALDDAPIGTAVVGLDGRFLWVNRALCAIVGYSAEELTRLTFQAITHADDLAIDVELARRLAAAEIPHYKLAKRYIRKDGSCVRIMLHASVVRDPEEQPLYYVAQIEDVTARLERDAQIESLQRENAKQAETYRTIVRHLPNAAVFLMDDRERFISADGPSLPDVLSEGSIGPAEVPGISLEDLASRGAPADPGEKAKLTKRYRDALNGWATRVEMKRGAHSFDVSTIPICDASGKPFAVLTLCYDVTESHRLNEALVASERQQRAIAAALERSEANLRLLLEKSPVGVAVTVSDRVTYANRALADMLRYERPSDLVDRNFLDFVHPDHRPNAERRASALRASDPLPASIVPLLASDGAEVVAEASAVIVDLDGGAVRLTVLHDITARRRLEQARDAAEAALRTSLQEKDVLLREVHHRVKNNLQVVSSLLNLEARRGDRPPHDPVHDAFVKTQMRVRSIALLHESLYQSSDVSRLAMRDYLASLMSGILRTYGEMAAGVRVDAEIENVDLRLDDAVPCGLIVNELVTNALKHAFHGDTVLPHVVRVKMSGSPEGVELVVSDNGSGFHDPTAAAGPATLGMRLVDSLATQLGGTATFHSKGGFSCRVWFPRD